MADTSWLTRHMSNHRVRWYVYTGRGSERIPRTSTMRGAWDYDAVCSCGWESLTGGGLERWVRQLVADHKAAARRATAEWKSDI